MHNGNMFFSFTNSRKILCISKHTSHAIMFSNIRGLSSKFKDLCSWIKLTELSCANHKLFTDKTLPMLYEIFKIEDQVFDTISYLKGICDFFISVLKRNLPKFSEIV